MIVIKIIVFLVCLAYFMTRSFISLKEDKEVHDVIASLLILATQLYALYWMAVTINKF